jgi:hypothetical protein
MTIVNIANPAKPRIEGVWECEGGWGDIDLSPDATIAVLANAHDGNCAEGGTAATILDISDKKHPKALSKIDLDDDVEYVHTVTLDNKLLYLNPQEWVGYPQTSQHIAVYDVSQPRLPIRKGFVEFTTGVMAVAHDQFIDHRPDKKNLMYSASIHSTDVLDVTDPLNAEMLQRTTSPEMTISHQSQPNHKRDVLIVDDESAVDAGVPVGAVCGRAGGPGAAAYDIGSVHFYGLDPDGTLTNNGLVELGSWNLPVHQTPATCTGHVFWPAPDQNRLTQAWYSEGAHILDFSDPANPVELGSFKADKPTMYWSAKPHRGYIFATDMDRGLDILRYTGEGGAKWPATSGPAEAQRAGFQGVPYSPLAVDQAGNAPYTGSSTTPLPAPQPAAQGSSSAQRALGRFAFKIRVKKAKMRARGKKIALTLRFTDTRGKRVGQLRFKRAARKAARAKVSGTAEAGRYRWTLRRGKKVVARGKFTVKPRNGLTLSPGARLSAGVR